MTLVEALYGEHGMLYTLFDHLEDRAEEGEALDTLAGVLEAALLAHARAEDELLFPEVEKAIGPMGPLAVMRAEHQEIESRVGRLDSLADLRDVLDLARGHFRKEEQVLFPMAVQQVGEERLRELGRLWAEARDVRVAI